MFSFLSKKLKYIQSLIGNGEKQQPSQKNDTLTGNLVKDLDSFKKLSGDSSDIVIRELVLGNKVSVAVIFIDGLAFEPAIREHILEPLIHWKGKDVLKQSDSDIFDELKNNLLPVGAIKEELSLNKIVNRVFAGDTALLVNGSKGALVFNIPGWERRIPSEPEAEVVVKGPREGFVETIRTNTALLRRKIGDPGLTFDTLEIGRRTRTEVSIAYLKEVVNPKLVEEVKRRLKRINTDAILSAGFIEEFIEDAPFSPFKTVGYTERPDVAAAKLTEGRVAIIVDGTPVVNTVPLLFVETFQSPDDYNFRPYFSTIIRWIRYLSFFLSVYTPAIYVALTEFHQEILPTELLISMAAAIEGTPFPTVVEAVTMGVVFEILREAGIRLPKAVGQAVSIVGALVIGESAVTAGIISAPIVIVVAATAIASFVVPQQNDAGTLLRIAFTLMAGFLGLLGIGILSIIILTHLVSLRSFGVPYLSPISPLMPKDLKDVLVRAPIWAMFTRPESIGVTDPVRQEFNLMPEPEKKDKTKEIN